MNNKESFIKELQACKKTMAFEFKTIDDDYILINIEYNKEKNVFYWQGLESIKTFNIDYDFSLDLNLQSLYDEVIQEYINIIDFEE